jgi:DNA-binding PadR family transcriptional regulator
MPDAPLTTLDRALLGIIDRGPSSGYDIHRLFSATPMAVFSASPGSIYPALARLERRGLLRAKLDSATEARPRRVYSITRQGVAALEAWLREPVTREELVRDARLPVLRFSLKRARDLPAGAGEGGHPTSSARFAKRHRGISLPSPMGRPRHRRPRARGS